MASSRCQSSGEADKITLNQTLKGARLGRKTRLAAGLALGLSLSSTLAAQPGEIKGQGAAANSGLMSAQVTTADPPIRGTGASAPAAVAADTRSTTATITVTNCNDSGAGSLRAAVASASSGDTVDLSGLSCDTINLTSSIVTTASDLTIQGGATSKYFPTPEISGQDAVTPLIHHGTGTLTLNSVYLEHGYTSQYGGCIYSAGNVALVDSWVKYCKARNTTASHVAGGAVWSDGEVSLDNSFVKHGYAATNGNGWARGGGIYSSLSTTLQNGSVVADSSVFVTNGTALGGGIYTGAGATTLVSHSSIFGNQARATSLGSAFGGGMNSNSDITTLSHAVVQGNHANSGGGGLALDTSIIEYSTIAENDTDGHGGGILLRGGLTMTNSSLVENHAYDWAGGMQASGRVIIRSSTIAGNLALAKAGLDLTYANTVLPHVIEQSTISGNKSFNSVGSGLVTGHNTIIRNSTITGNVESNTTDTIGGAGILLEQGVSVTLYSTIVAGNRLALNKYDAVPSDIGTGPYALGNESVSGDHNAIGHSEVPVPPDTIVPGPGLRLRPLQDNGGPTRTHEPVGCSVVVDAGTANGFTWDQRGSGYPRISGSAADIGAVEYPVDRIFADGFEDFRGGCGP